MTPFPVDPKDRLLVCVAAELLLKRPGVFEDYLLVCGELDGVPRHPTDGRRREHAALPRRVAADAVALREERVLGRERNHPARRERKTSRAGNILQRRTAQREKRIRGNVEKSVCPAWHARAGGNMRPCARLVSPDGNYAPGVLAPEKRAGDAGAVRRRDLHAVCGKPECHGVRFAIPGDRHLHKGESGVHGRELGLPGDGHPPRRQRDASVLDNNGAAAGPRRALQREVERDAVHGNRPAAK